ncbi:phage tail tape measure protein [Pseudomonas sp.]|uniref:phage tail tape measure protein n=1 Tax=Pseudomonas sp. TaxID=306 RepID=UPI003D0E6942
MLIRSKAETHQLKALNEELKKIAENAARASRSRGIFRSVFGARTISIARMIGDSAPRVMAFVRQFGLLRAAAGAAGIAMRGALSLLGGPLGLAAAAGLTAIRMAAAGVRAGIRLVGVVISGVVRAFQWLGRMAVSVLRSIRGLVGGVIARLRTLALAGAAALAAFAYAGTKAVNTYADFEQAVRNAMTVTGLFGRELERAEAIMSRFARQVAARSTKTATDVANAYYALASAGLSVNEIMAATPGVIALAEATQSELGMTTELVTATLRAFRLEATETNRVVNTFAAAISASPLNMERLAYSLQYAAPVAAAFGMTVEDTVAALAMLAKAGIYGSIAGTALRGMLTREEAPAEKAVKILREYGLTLRDVSVQQVGFANVLRNLRAAGVRPADVMQIFGLRAGPAVLALLRQGADEFVRIRQQITGTNFAFRLQALQLQTIQGQWKILRSQLEEARHSFGSAARGGVMFLLRALQGLVQSLRRVGIFRAAGTAFAAMAAALGAAFHAIAAQAPQIQGAVAALAGVFVRLVSGAAQRAPTLVQRLGQFLARLPTYVSIAAQWLTAFASKAWRLFTAAIGKGVGYVILGLSWLSQKFGQAAAWLTAEWPRVSAMIVDWMIRIAETALDIGVAIQGGFYWAIVVVKNLARAFVGAAETALVLAHALGMVSAQRIIEAQRALWPILRWGLTPTMPPDTSWRDRGYRWLESRRQQWKTQAAGAGQWLAPRLQAAGATTGQWANQVVVVVYANDLGVVGQIAQQTVERATRQRRRDRVR